MDHKTLINRVASRMDAEIDEAQSLLDGFIQLLVQAASENDAVAIPAFGTFEARARMERVSLHPVSGRRLLIPPKIVMGFKPSTVMKNRLNELSDDEQ